VQTAALVPLLIRVHDDGEKLPAAPPLEKETLPDGLVGLGEVSVTVAVQEAAEPTVTEAGVHETTVEVVLREPLTTETLSVAVLAGIPVAVALVMTLTSVPAAIVVLSEICVVPLPPAARGTDAGLKLTNRLGRRT
jgi:hypothetical protein